MAWRSWRSLGRLALLAAVALAAAGCFKADAQTSVGGDGAAVTSFVIELDLELFESLFGGFAESMGEDPDVEVPDDQPSLTEQMTEDLDELDAQLDDLYERRPELRDRFAVDAAFEDGTLTMRVDARTEDAEQLAVLYDSLLGSGSGGLGEIYGLEDEELFDEESSDFGTGPGSFESFDVSMDDDRFVFEATPPAGGEVGDDLELDFEGFPGLTPEITITVNAPGDVVETNGDADGRTVTWELDGSESDPLRLVSEVDPSAEAGELGGGSDDDSFPVALVVAVLVVVAGVAGVVVVLRRRGAGGRDGDPAPDGGPGSPAP